MMVAPAGSITVVVPAFNEAESIVATIDAVLSTLHRFDRELRVTIVVVDDGSEDDTAVRVHEAACARPGSIELVRLIRNFGKEAAIAAGLDHASGDAVIVMDADLQHPPELLPLMVRHWFDGAEVVEACKRERGDEARAARRLAGLFYRVFRAGSGLDIRNHTDFKLLDRRVVDTYRLLPERSLFFRGLVKWMGFRTVSIPFDVPARAGGRSAWTIPRLLRYSAAALTSFSSAPLQLVTVLGAVTFGVSLVFGSIALFQKLTGRALDGFTTVILLELFIGSVLMFSLGLIGSYLARMYDEIKGRPRYLVDRGGSGVDTKR